MQTTASRLEIIIDLHLPALQLIPESVFSFKPSPAKWSRKEILGHLVDSAQNNIRRFVAAQYEDTPFIVYDQDKWVAIVGYQQWDTKSIIDLWYLLNKQVCAILRNTPTAMYQRQAQSQEFHTIEWLAEDYVKHLLHHLHVVLDLEPMAYP
jgi:DinB superfamily